LAGAGGFEPRYGELESDALGCPRGAAEPLFIEIYRPFETLDFREPYRIRGVQSFGDKWAFRRIMSAPCREGVQSSNEKSLQLLGLIAHKLSRRICGFGQGGGGRGTGIEPSPRHPVRWEGSPSWTAYDPSDGGTVFARQPSVPRGPPKCATTFDPVRFLPQTPCGLRTCRALRKAQHLSKPPLDLDISRGLCSPSQPAHLPFTPAGGPFVRQLGRVAWCSPQFRSANIVIC
jgi:hypothetical protein